MTVRKNKRRVQSLADVVDTLPAHLLSIEFDAQEPLNSLRQYVFELQRHLSTEVGYVVDQLVVAGVMADLGADVAACYRVMLGLPHR